MNNQAERNKLEISERINSSRSPIRTNVCYQSRKRAMNFGVEFVSCSFRK